MSPECPVSISNSTALLTCASSGSGEYGRCLIAEVEQFPFGTDDGTTVKILRHGFGIESRRHDDDSQIGPRPLQAFQQRQREIAFEVALMEFIEHHCSHALQGWIGKQTPGEYAFSDKSQARARANRFFKPDLVSDRLADRFAEFPCDSTRRQSRRDPARLEHNHFTAHDPKQRGRHPGRLPRTRSGHDHKVRVQS